MKTLDAIRSQSHYVLIDVQKPLAVSLAHKKIFLHVYVFLVKGGTTLIS